MFRTPSRPTSRSIPAAVGFDVVYPTVGGKVLDASFEAVRRFGHVVSALGWGTHALFAAIVPRHLFGGLTLLPLLSGGGRAHHGEIMMQATRLVETSKLVPRLDPRRFYAGKRW